MKIAMINCLKSNKRCAGAACLTAYEQKSRSFACYGDRQTELTAFARCNGCEAGIDDGFAEKLQRIIDSGTEVVHFGKCTVKEGKECEVISRAAAILEQGGVRVVRGTH